MPRDNDKNNDSRGRRDRPGDGKGPEDDAVIAGPQRVARHGAHPLPGFDQSDLLHPGDGLAEGGPIDTQPFGEFALGGQSRPGWVVAGQHRVDQQVRHLGGEGPPFRPP